MLWQDSCSRILKTFTFGPPAGAFNARNPIKLEELLERPVVIELDQELPKPLRAFIAEVVLRWIHLYRLGQGEADHNRKGGKDPKCQQIRCARSSARKSVSFRSTGSRIRRGDRMRTQTWAARGDSANGRNEFSRS